MKLSKLTSQELYGRQKEELIIRVKTKLRIKQSVVSCDLDDLFDL